MELTGKVALITGGGTGLGKEVTLALAKEGAQIAISYAKSKTDADQTVAEILAMGGKATAFQADLSLKGEPASLVRRVAETYSRIDLLIHNAATTRFVPFSNLEAVDEEAWDEILALNARAAFFLARAAAPIMRQNGGGQIITTSSVAGLGAVGSSIPYAASKAALIHITKCLAKALAPDILVNSVAPGLLLTRWVAGFSEEQITAMSDRALLKKTPTLEDVAAIFLMLAKNESMTGQVIVADAGLLSA